jgi:hypothetical protein
VRHFRSNQIKVDNNGTFDIQSTKINEKNQ